MLHPATISRINVLKQPVSEDSSFETKVVVKCWLLFHSASVYKLVQVVSSRFGVRFCPTLMRRISARFIARVDLSTCLYSAGAVRAAEPVASFRRNNRNQAIALRTWHGSIFEQQNKDTQKTDASEEERDGKWNLLARIVRMNTGQISEGGSTGGNAFIPVLLQKNQTVMPMSTHVCIECIMNVHTS